MQCTGGYTRHLKGLLCKSHLSAQHISQMLAGRPFVKAPAFGDCWQWISVFALWRFSFKDFEELWQHLSEGSSVCDMSGRAAAQPSAPSVPPRPGFLKFQDTCSVCLSKEPSCPTRGGTGSRGCPGHVGLAVFQQSWAEWGLPELQREGHSHRGPRGAEAKMITQHPEVFQDSDLRSDG